MTLRLKATAPSANGEVLARHEHLRGLIERAKTRGAEAEATRMLARKHPDHFEGSTLSDDQREEFFQGYVNCALWSSADTPPGGSEPEPLDEDYGPDDIADETLDAMRADCNDFIDGSGIDLADYVAARSAGDAGHDFWLTRNGHGAGFWDRGLGELGDRLAAMTKPYGSFDLYIGDDRKVYGS